MKKLIGNPSDDVYTQGSDDCAAYAPTKGVISKKFDAKPDAPFSNRGMNDKFWRRPRDFNSVFKEVLCPVNVVDLIKYEAFRCTEIPDTQDEGDERNKDRCHIRSLSAKAQNPERMEP